MTIALQSNSFQNPGGVAWAWHIQQRSLRSSSRTVLPQYSNILISNILSILILDLLVLLSCQKLYNIGTLLEAIFCTIPVNHRKVQKIVYFKSNKLGRKEQKQVIWCGLFLFYLLICSCDKKVLNRTEWGFLLVSRPFRMELHQ